MKTRKFIDSATLEVRAGDGGNGCVSFRRERHVPRGGPDGGDGGNGGSVILRVDPDVDSLIDIHFAPLRRADSGGAGRGQKCHGRKGHDLVIPVPRGTEVRDADCGELLADLVVPDETYVAVRGGKGGKGNCHWLSATHQAPMEHTDGTSGGQARLCLDLKLTADIGLVGFPNAGKSSLLTCISDAHPRVAAYPFTTLNPIIGTMFFADYSRATVADIPGLIKDAHRGVGLGHGFLRHIERASCLVYVLDMAGMDGRTPWDDYDALRRELTLYNPELIHRPSLVVANKMDLSEAVANLAAFRDHAGVDPIEVSAETGAGIDGLKQAMENLFRNVSAPSA